MRRHRQQKGFVYRDGGSWYVRYYDDRAINGQVQRKRLAKQLGPCAGMNVTRARKEAENFLNGINETICGRPPGTNVFFRIRSQPN